MRSSDFASFGQQTDLALIRAPQKVSVPIEMIRSRKNSGAAFTLACDTCALDDKEIAGAMVPPIDAGTFSRLKSGKNTLDANRVAEFCRVVGNMIYPEWQAYQVGCTLVMIRTEAERRAEAAEARANEAEKKLRWAMEVMSGKAA